MKIEPFDENQICNLISPGSLGIDEKYDFAKAVARAAQANALRQVIKEAKRTSAIIETSPNDYEVDVSRAYKFFKSLQSALNELEKES